MTGYMKSRFGVDLNPKKTMLALIGSKEGIAPFAKAFIWTRATSPWCRCRTILH